MSMCCANHHEKFNNSSTNAFVGLQANNSLGTDFFADRPAAVEAEQDGTINISAFDDIVIASVNSTEMYSTANGGSPRSPNNNTRQRKRVCVFPGCTKTVKAQGHCQKHGATIKRCKTAGCDKQVQGSHNGHCKRHWREFLAPDDQRKKAKKTMNQQEEEQKTFDPVGSSVFDHILPASFAWKVEGICEIKKSSGKGSTKREILKEKGAESQTELIPILQHLVENESLDPGWHRVNERLVRGIRPPKSLSVQFEPWESQLALMEMALIAGTDTKNLSQQKISKVISHAWGREKGFHKKVIEKHCARMGDVKRKKRVDAGTVKSPKTRKTVLNKEPHVHETVLPEPGSEIEISAVMTPSYTHRLKGIDEPANESLE